MWRGWLSNRESHPGESCDREKWYVTSRASHVVDLEARCENVFERLLAPFYDWLADRFTNLFPLDGPFSYLTKQRVEFPSLLC